MEMIKRNRYLDQISPFIDKDLIKVLIGLRRSGKTILLSQIRDILLDQGVPEKNIIEIMAPYICSDFFHMLPAFKMRVSPRALRRSLP